MRAVVIAEKGSSPSLTDLAGAGAALAGLLTEKGRLASTLSLDPTSRTYTLPELPAAFGDFAGGILGKLAITLA